MVLSVKPGIIVEVTQTRERESVMMEGEIDGLVQRLGQSFGRDTVPLDVGECEIGIAVEVLEQEAEVWQRRHPWPRIPLLSVTVSGLLLLFVLFLSLIMLINSDR